MGNSKELFSAIDGSLSMMHGTRCCFLGDDGAELAANVIGSAVAKETRLTEEELEL